MEKEWYVVNTYSGHEQKVKEKLEAKIESMGMQDYIFRVIIPETTEVEVKDGVKKEKCVNSQKEMLPERQHFRKNLDISLLSAVSDVCRRGWGCDRQR